MLASQSREGVVFLVLLPSSHLTVYHVLSLSLSGINWRSLFPPLGPVPLSPRWRPYWQGPRTLPFQGPRQLSLWKQRHSLWYLLCHIGAVIASDNYHSDDFITIIPSDSYRCEGFPLLYTREVPPPLLNIGGTWGVSGHPREWEAGGGRGTLYGTCCRRKKKKTRINLCTRRCVRIFKVE